MRHCRPNKRKLRETDISVWSDFADRITPIPDPLERATDRLRHRRPDEQLAADGAREERLARPARPLAARNFATYASPLVKSPAYDPGTAEALSLAGGVHGHRVRPEQGEGHDHEDRRPGGPGLRAGSG